MPRIKALGHHAAEGTIPKGLRIRNVKAKGNNETLQAKFDDIIREAELKLLDAAIDNLRTDVEANREELKEREANVDGAICKWKIYLIQSKEITSEQVDSLVETATSFAENLSSDNAINRFESATSATSGNCSQRKQTARKHGIERGLYSIRTVDLRNNQAGNSSRKRFSTCRQRPAKKGLLLQQPWKTKSFKTTTTKAASTGFIKVAAKSFQIAEFKSV